MGRITRKKRTAAIRTNPITSSMKAPYLNVALRIEKERSAKLALSPGMARMGVSRFLVNEVITAVKAAPMATPTARSTTLPRRMKVLKSFTASFTTAPPEPGIRSSDGRILSHSGRFLTEYGETPGKKQFNHFVEV